MNEDNNKNSDAEKVEVEKSVVSSQQSVEEKKSEVEDKISEVEEKNSEVEDKNSDAEEKIFYTETGDDEKNDKIIASLNKKSWTEKFSAPLETLQDLLEEISWKYIAAVTGGVLFCIFVVGAVLIFADSPTNFISQTISEENSAEKRIHVKIHGGMSTAEIADALAEKNVISNSLKFRLLSRLRGYDDQMKPGTYIFHAGMSYDDVFSKILNGEKQVFTFTIPEGFTVKDIAKRLYGLDFVDEEDFLKAAEDFAPYDYMKKHKNVFYAAEGFLFPDTYTVESDASVEEVLKIMAANFDNRLTPDIRNRAKEKNLSIYDLAILASLVEKEVRYPEDRAIVAQVFFKRLQLNMPLQTDASLQYLMDAPKEDVSIEDTKIDSPYNTYQHAGLPPGPVANAGIEAIEAVLNPADTDYLYFVADRQGHNHYATTYEEHMALVNQYR